MAETSATTPLIAVVIPCFRVQEQILEVLSSIGPEVGKIYVVDDACPEGTGRHVEREVTDQRVQVLFHEENLGVGGATMTGYRQALADGAAVIVKLDGDGQMDGRLIPRFVQPILAGQADYTKGNRFFDLESLHQMPWLRLCGNAVLSFMSKLATGYWDLFDPTNGFTAIHAQIVSLLPLNKISRRYFFESDILFRLNTVRAVIVEIPMESCYGEERSNLRIGQATVEFAAKNTLNFLKRVFYNFFLRGFSIASVHLVIGLLLVLLGGVYGAYHWVLSWKTGIPASSGTVMVASLPIIVGVQLLMNFLAYDIQSVPRVALHPRLRDDRVER